MHNVIMEVSAASGAEFVRRDEQIQQVSNLYRRTGGSER